MQKIMFNDRYGLTDAVIEGRKTMTRRLVSDRLWEMWTDYDDFCNSVIGGIARDGTSVSREYYHECDFFKDKCRYNVGEIVAVAQSYEQAYRQGNMNADEAIIRGLKYDPGMCNKMYVRAALMPHQIRITGIRCERLQDISDEECMREGILESWYESTDTTTYGYAARMDMPTRKREQPLNLTLPAKPSPRLSTRCPAVGLGGATRGWWLTNSNW